MVRSKARSHPRVEGGTVLEALPPAPNRVELRLAAGDRRGSHPRSRRPERSLVAKATEWVEGSLRDGVTARSTRRAILRRKSISSRGVRRPPRRGSAGRDGLDDHGHSNVLARRAHLRERE